MDKFSFFILNIVLNSFLAFFTTVLLMEILISLFRIQQGRCAAFLRMMPLVKLVCDPFLYDFSRWSYAHGINPLHCAEGTRTLSVMFGWIDTVCGWFFVPMTSGIQLTLPGGLTFTLADLIGYHLPLPLLRGFALLFTCVTACLLVRKIVVYFSHAKMLKNLEAIKNFPKKKILNVQIRAFLKKHSLKIIVSPHLQGSPFVTGFLSSTIFIPENLSQKLSQKEYESVLAHEIEHIRYQDSLMRFLFNLMSSVFWWIPTKWWRNRIEEGQERACDLQCKKYGVDPLDLASAICKSAKTTSQQEALLFAHHLAKKHQIHKRVKALLTPPPHLKKTRFVLAAFAVGVSFFGIFLGRYWIF
jgi:hypothetical protein